MQNDEHKAMNGQGIPLFVLKGIVHVYNGNGNGQPALDIGSLSISEGATVSIIGPNAAGKSTLMRILAHLVSPLKGEALFMGNPIDLTQARKFYIDAKVAYAAQSPYLYKTSVLANVIMPLKFRGLGRSEAKQKALQALGLLGVEHLASKNSPRELSGGELKKVALARALAVDPKILLLDEPFANLDDDGVGRLKDLLEKLKARNATIITSSPENGKISPLINADIIRLENGRISETR